jgi:hypothetical protein
VGSNPHPYRDRQFAPGLAEFPNRAMDVNVFGDAPNFASTFVDCWTGKVGGLFVIENPAGVTPIRRHKSVMLAAASGEP